MEYLKDTQMYMEKYRLLLASGETLSLPVLGSSMSPFLVHGRDTVWLTAPGKPLKAGDIVLYRRSNGQYILHRIYKAHDGTYTLIGDAHTVLESGIREDQIFGIVVYARRKGKIQKPGTFCWFFFERIWIRMIPMRPLLLRIYTWTSRIFRRLS